MPEEQKSKTSCGGLKNLNIGNYKMIDMINLVKVLYDPDTGKSVGDIGIFQRIKCLFYGKTQNIKVLNMYGISFNPPDDSFGVAFSPNGHDSDMLAIVDKPELRPKDLAKGEFRVGNYLTGDYILFKVDGTIKVVSSISVDVTAPNVTVTGDVTITGDVNVTGDITATGNVDANDLITPSVASYDGHTHSGVTTGAGSTGGPS